MDRFTYLTQSALNIDIGPHHSLLRHAAGIHLRHLLLHLHSLLLLLLLLLDVALIAAGGEQLPAAQQPLLQRSGQGGGARGLAISSKMKYFREITRQF